MNNTELEMPSCGLCQAANPKLIDSHLIPRSAYKRLNTSPMNKTDERIRINFGPNDAYFYQKHIKHIFLCKDCEEKFSNNGEKIIGTLWPKATTFPLRDNLETRNHLSQNELNGLFYFAISVFLARQCMARTYRRLQPSPWKGLHKKV